MEKNIALFYKNPMLFKLSKKQLEYLNKANYNIITPDGNNYQRTSNLIDYNERSGNILVEEKVLFSKDKYKYEKTYVLSEDGKKVKICR